jgi:hypothetical protein
MKRPNRRKPKPSRPKTRAKTRAKSMSKRARPSKPASAVGDGIDALVTAGTQALGLPLDPAWRPAVMFNLRLILRMAALVDAFTLPDDAEPAPVFHA